MYVYWDSHLPECVGDYSKPLGFAADVFCFMEDPRCLLCA